jgi:adenylate cyclase class 2
MQQEIEAKFLHQDLEKVREGLKTAGGSCIQKLTDVRRVNLDYTDYALDKKRAWLRVRDNGDNKVTVAYKQKNAKDVAIDGVTEIEVDVAEYEQMVQIFQAIGLVEKSVQHTKREIWELDGCEVMLDVWPWVDPYIEIEGASELLVRQAAEKLGYSWEDAKFGDVGVVYFDEYEMTEDELYIELKYFEIDTPIPDWLEQRRRAAAGR